MEGGDQGTAVIRRLVQQMEAHAAAGARALLEISEEQGKAVAQLVRDELPRAVVTVHQDLEGLDRVVEIQLQNGTYP